MTMNVGIVLQKAPHTLGLFSSSSVSRNKMQAFNLETALKILFSAFFIFSRGFVALCPEFH